MKNIIIIFPLFLLFAACNSDDEVNPVITASGFEITISENPEDGLVLGTIEAETDKGELTFEIASETAIGALAIDEVTGIITVADASLFDFETNPVITAEIEVVSGKTIESVTVQVNLIDKGYLRFADFNHNLESGVNFYLTNIQVIQLQNGTYVVLTDYVLTDGEYLAGSYTDQNSYSGESFILGFQTGYGTDAELTPSVNLAYYVMYNNWSSISSTSLFVSDFTYRTNTSHFFSIGNSSEGSELDVIFTCDEQDICITDYSMTNGLFSYQYMNLDQTWTELDVEVDFSFEGSPVDLWAN